MQVSNLKLTFADYIMDMQLPKDIPKHRDKFNNICYTKWAVNELLMYIIRRKDQTTIAAIKEFIDKMDMFSSINKKDGSMFFTAKCVAEEMLSILYCNKPLREEFLNEKNYEKGVSS